MAPACRERTKMRMNVAIYDAKRNDDDRRHSQRYDRDATRTSKKRIISPPPLNRVRARRQLRRPLRRCFLRRRRWLLPAPTPWRSPSILFRGRDLDARRRYSDGDRFPHSDCCYSSQRAILRRGDDFRRTIRGDERTSVVERRSDESDHQQRRMRKAFPFSPETRRKKKNRRRRLLPLPPDPPLLRRHWRGRLEEWKCR